ncbi:hypothetical protein C8R45DRAFT_1094241 [Mycena sanguinolenta]|nr:hypothetical protein C8R45DRAFT_1094241 [Mycena sanguinolenta]
MADLTTKTSDVFLDFDRSFDFDTVTTATLRQNYPVDDWPVEYYSSLADEIIAVPPRIVQWSRALCRCFALGQFEDAVRSMGVLPGCWAPVLRRDTYRFRSFANATRLDCDGRD